MSFTASPMPRGGCPCSSSTSATTSSPTTTFSRYSHPVLCSDAATNTYGYWFPASLLTEVSHRGASFNLFFNDTATTAIYTLSLHDAFSFFFEEHAPQLHLPSYLLCRLLL